MHSSWLRGKEMHADYVTTQPACDSYADNTTSEQSAHALRPRSDMHTISKHRITKRQNRQDEGCAVTAVNCDCKTETYLSQS